MKLRVIKQLGGNALHYDALEALHYQNAAGKDPYDTSLLKLFEKAEEEVPKAQLVKSVAA